MADPKVLKVFHAARQDVEIFFHMTGTIPAPLVDTQVAAMVCGFGDAVSYENLAAKLAGARIDKCSRFTDWAHRPLTDRQLQYALSDVTHLRPTYEHLARRLAQDRAHRLGRRGDGGADRSHHLSPGAARGLAAASSSRNDKPRPLAILREVAAWREEEAQRRDLPRNRVLRDETLLRDRRPCAERRRASRPLPRAVAGHRREPPGRPDPGRRQARAGAAGRANAPSPPPRRDLPSGIGPLIELLRVLLKMRCEDHDVAAEAGRQRRRSRADRRR